VSGKPDLTASVQPDMNVTPLVDVVLVLLIIFMVVAPRLEQDVPVNLPGVVNPDPVAAAGEDALKVTVAATGEVWIDDRRTDPEGVVAALQAAHAADPERRLEVRGDERLRYGQVRAVCAEAQKIGFPGVALLVGERHRRHDAGDAS
jgi:biopolymer transport protein ExbD/biopolymer transport protein TolR